MSNKLNGLLKQVNEATKEVISAINKYDAQIAALQAQRQAIGAAQVNRADFIAYVGGMVDARAGHFSGQIERALAKVDTSFFSLEKMGSPVNFLTPWLGGASVIQEDACYWYLKDAILAKVREIADDMDFTDDALPVETRRTMIAAIDAEIDQLRTERGELASQLQKAGLVR